MSVDSSTAPRSRMSAEDRRGLVLEAATRAFGRDGYAGTTTDAISREAGVSQPYVVRIFGTKLELFLEVFAGCIETIRASFAAVLDDGPFDPDADDDWARLGLAYGDLIEDRDRLLVLMHGFTASAVPEIGSLARTGMAGIYGTIMRSGCTPERAREFVAHGMLLNVLVAIGAPEHVEDDARLAELTDCAFSLESIVD